MFLENVRAVRQNVFVMKYVDLFAGCGGLSLGIERAGGELVVAVEKSDMAARTFYHNLVDDASDPRQWNKYVESPVEVQVAGKVLVRELSVLLKDELAMEKLAGASLDLVVGGPPCQGFSLAGLRNPDDIRNKLPWEYLQFVARTRPRAVVIENVVGMNQRFSSQEESSFSQLQQALAETEPGYVVQGVRVNAMHYGAPQHRPRLMILAVRADVAKTRGINATDMLWKSDFSDKVSHPLPDLVPVPTVSSDQVLTVAHAVADLSPHAPSSSRVASAGYVRQMQSKEWKLRTRPGKHEHNHVPRNHAQRTKQRFRLYQFLSVAGLDQRLVSRAAGMPESDALLYLKTQLEDAPLPALAPDGTELASNLDELCDLVMRLATKKHSQRVLGWKEPARTVVTLPDDYVHPAEPRIFTVREMARFQGFPSGFEFLGKETTGAHRRRVEVPQYSQVGNAVSPWLSLAVGNRLAEILGDACCEETESPRS
ncbi:DNA (cytosine-5)-methyltransferase 1 [Arthrobacter sp. SLBN-100]|uniref:DNA cytosine methyltransferase n=1 Tax=Arthrobacter sp. SLBN-100 TaxID=2768450 RepID=UPI00116A8257|nr:DNA cytosine methyltransferase [Arthrobacter sp. SLBN-100]TQJ69726.1 DNA (cytosine-5)-methyltransferase 1 [Arthrobacter sp. SLBN-100]